MDITGRVVKRMQELGITQVELGEALGITKSTLNYLIINHKHFEADHVIALANKLNVSVSWLLTGDDNRIASREIIKEVRIDLAEDQEELLNIYREMDLQGRTMILAEAYKQRGRCRAKSQEEEEPHFIEVPA